MKQARRGILNRAWMERNTYPGELPRQAALIDELAAALAKTKRFLEHFMWLRHLPGHPEVCAHCILLKETQAALTKYEAAKVGR